MNVYQWLCVLGIPGMLAGLLGFICLQVKQNRAMKLAVQAMLRDRLLQGYKYYEQLGYADYDDRKNMENMYSAYHGLGENGVMDDMQKKFSACYPVSAGGIDLVLRNRAGLSPQPEEVEELVRENEKDSLRLTAVNSLFPGNW